MTCRPNTNVVAKLDYFLLDSNSASNHLYSVMERRGVPSAFPNRGRTCEDGVKSSWSGGIGVEEACFRRNGRAQLRVWDDATADMTPEGETVCHRDLKVGDATLRSPAIYVALRGTSNDIARLYGWATRNPDDDSGQTNSIMQSIPSDLGSSLPGCPT